MNEIYKKISEVIEQGRNAVLCTVVSAKGSTPLKEGAKMLVYSDGSTFGTVGGGTVERMTIEKADFCIKTCSNKLLKVDLISDEGLSCGGKVEVFIESLNYSKKLYIFGGGHVGKALAELTVKVGFDTTVVDNRKGIFNDWHIIGVRTVTTDINEYIKNMDFNDRLFIAILTYDHNMDWQILSQCAEKEWCYLGLMGSKSKVKQMKKNLSEKGVSEEIIGEIDMPIGIEIEAETAHEIAVSISSKLIKEKNILAKKLKKLSQNI